MGDVVNFFSGLTYHPSDVKNKGYFVIRSSNIQNNQIVSADDIFVNKDIINVPNVKQGDIIVVVRNGSRKLIGKHAQVLTDMPNTVIGAFMTGVRSKSNFYINALLDSDQFQKEIYKNLGATINQITIGEFRKMRFIITSGNEAQTIGEFFKKIDTLITLQQRKLEQLKQLKKAMLQQLFVDKNNKQPTLRFKNFKGDWKQHRLGEISTKVTTKNQSNASLPVFTNSAKDGIVNQEKFFDKQIANNTSNYYVVNNNDFVYNPRISKNAPFGPIRRNTLNKTGIMSPLYYIFSLSHNTDENFLSFYFLSSKWYKFMYENGDSGARSDRFAIKDKVFQQMPIKLPLIIEQTEIGKFLNYVNILISLQQTKLTQLTTLKKYLLQKMFI